MFNVVLMEPEIPPNTGNIIRLCVNCGARLHLIEPLGFRLDDRELKRAGLDYHEYAELKSHASYAEFLEETGPARMFAFSTRGARSYSDINYLAGDTFLFGPETRGLSDRVLSGLPMDEIVRIPMVRHSRSLNLSNAVAVVLYEAWRQIGFAGAGGKRPL
jgi:tRNA (cytidine/uridine-2'-O-)-methyltransferase